MSPETIQSIATSIPAALIVLTLVLTIRKMREEMYVPKITPVIVIAITGLAVFVYAMLTRTPINWWLAALLLAVGCLIGWFEGQMTRLYYRGPIIVGKRSVAYLVFWGLAYLLTMALTQTGSTALHAVGVLSMMFGLGIAVGDNLNLLMRQATLKPQPATTAPPAAPVAPAVGFTGRPATPMMSFAVGTPPASSENPFQRAENEYFRLRGQLETGRITRAQFESALKHLMLQDAQGRHWTLGADSGKWHVYDGRAWIESNPYAAVSPPPPPFASPPAPPAPPIYVAQTPPSAQSKRGGCGGCGGCLIVCLVLIALVASVAVGGFLAYQSGALTPATLLNLVGLGPGDIEVDNFRDDAIQVSIRQVEVAPDAAPASGALSLDPFDIKSYRAQNPGRYRVEFALKQGGTLGTCTLTVKSGDRYQFVALPARIAVNRANNPSSVGTDFVVQTSSLCR